MLMSFYSSSEAAERREGLEEGRRRTIAPVFAAMRRRRRRGAPILLPVAGLLHGLVHVKGLVVVGRVGERRRAEGHRRDRRPCAQ